MSHRISIGAVSTSASGFHDSSKDIAAESHLRWDNIKNFVYLAAAFSSTNFNFDIFSGITQEVTIFAFFAIQITIGISYMFMDSFIKLYTGKVDFNVNLNPLLKGITYGVLFQSLLWTLLHANDLADAVVFFLSSLKQIPPWSKCDTHASREKCIPTKDVFLQCQQMKRKAEINATSAHFHYMSVFRTQERSTMTTRFFLIAIVWILNFFFSSLSDLTLIKVFKLMYILRSFTTLFSAGFVLITCSQHFTVAIGDIMNVTAAVSLTDTFGQVAYIYGVGLVGIYDFGVLSPYTYIDNAILVFTTTFTFYALLRSLVTRMLFHVLLTCVNVHLERFLNSVDNVRYLMFVIIPLATESLKASKVYTLYLYLYMILTLSGHIAAFTLTVSKILHSEFKAIKNVYIVGIISFICCGLSIALSLNFHYSSGLVNGLDMTMFYLGAVRVGIIMYMYGLKRFCTDVQFWLNFKPTKFWRACWALMPLVLMYVGTMMLVDLVQRPLDDKSIPVFVWFSFSLVIVTLIQIKTIINYIMDNNLTAAFRSSLKYGPPDGEERKRRRKYDETVNLRICKHSCILLDDKFECNHMPLMRTGETEDTAIKPIFEANKQDRKQSSFIDLTIDD